MWLTIAQAFGMACGVALLVTPLLILLAPAWGAVDKPSPRKIHASSMPCIGGVGIGMAFYLSLWFSGQLVAVDFWGLLAGGLIILGLGVIDDLRDLSPYIKLAGQIVAAALVALSGIQVEFITHPLTDGVYALGLLAVPLTIFWIVAVTNAVNLIDGLDGLAAGVSALAALVLAAVAWLEGQLAVAVGAMALAGGAFGFLRYNFHPARIFMGDSGAMFLGFHLAVFALLGLSKSTTAYSLVIPFVILGIPLLDTMFAVVRRLLSGQPIFRADRDHLHHRLLAIGLSHRQTVIVIYAISAVYGISALALSWLATPRAFIVLGLLAVGTIAGAERLGVLRLKLRPSRYRS